MLLAGGTQGEEELSDHQLLSAQYNLPFISAGFLHLRTLRWGGLLE